MQLIKKALNLNDQQYEEQKEIWKKVREPIEKRYEEERMERMSRNHEIEMRNKVREIEKNMPVPKGEKPSGDSGSAPIGNGDIIDQAVEVLIEAGQASVSYLQRKLKLGYASAARVMDKLEELGVVSPYEGSKPRSVLVTREMWAQRKLINNDMISDTDVLDETVEE